jgi:hypothetical protein
MAELTIHQSTNPSIHPFPGVGIEFGHSEKLVAGLFDPILHPQPVEQRALGLLLVGGDFEREPEAGPP